MILLLDFVLNEALLSSQRQANDLLNSRFRQTKFARFLHFFCHHFQAKKKFCNNRVHVQHTTATEQRGDSVAIEGSQPICIARIIKTDANKIKFILLFSRFRSRNS